MYELQTNDPETPLLKFALAGLIRPLPAFARRIENANLQHGDEIDGFRVWPAAHPSFLIQPGERYEVQFRLRPVDENTAELQLASDAPGTCRLTRDAHGYWLSLVLEPPDDTAVHTVALPLSVRAHPKGVEKLSLDVTFRVVSENFVVIPQTLNFGEIAITDTKSGSLQVGRLGLRKYLGTFRIKSLSISLAFLSADAVTVVEGSSYLVRIRLKPGARLKAGRHEGVLRIETDDAEHKAIEVPCRLVIK